MNLINRFTWGNSDHGKLGRSAVKKVETSKYYNTRSYMEKSVYSKPEKVDSLKDKKVVQIACGNYHTVNKLPKLKHFNN